MGVTHGANAVTGILNIITKKKSRLPWEIGYTLQEESIGQEYNFLNKGRNIQSFKASHSFNDNWYVSVGIEISQIPIALTNDFGIFYFSA